MKYLALFSLKTLKKIIMSSAEVLIGTFRVNNNLAAQLSQNSVLKVAKTKF